jgi:hypothetical protein
MLLKAWIRRFYDSVPNAPAVFGYGCRYGEDGSLVVPVLAVHAQTRAKKLKAELWMNSKTKPQRIYVLWPGFEPGEYRNVRLEIGGRNAAKSRG